MRGRMRRVRGAAGALRQSLPVHWSSVVIHPRAVPPSRFLAKAVAYDAAEHPRLRRVATVVGGSVALRHALGPARPDAAVDRLLDALHAGWGRLVEAATPGRLPDRPPARDGMSVLVLDTEAASSVFVFGTDPTPLVVARLRGGQGEHEALVRAKGSGVAPLPLGEVAGACVHEGVPAEAVEVSRSVAGDPGALRWTKQFRSLGHALIQVSETTRSLAPHTELTAAVAAVLGSGVDVPSGVAAAVRDTEGVKLSVLRHGRPWGRDWLALHGGGTVLVDWKSAVPAGVPGFDVLDAAMSWFEQVSDADSFEAAWVRSPFFAGARRAAVDAMSAAGVPVPLHAGVMTAYFTFRLGRLLEAGADEDRVKDARRMLSLVAR